jgi:hypothetical protein
MQKKKKDDGKRNLWRVLNTQDERVRNGDKGTRTSRDASERAGGRANGRTDEQVTDNL